MRAGVDGLLPPRSLAEGLPTVFFGNDFTGDLVGAFDDVLAPVFATLDDFDGYLDPRLAPADFVRWVASWLGFGVDERWPTDRLRAGLPDLREAVRWRGTVRAVAAAVRAYTGQQPEVTDNGGVAGSQRPLGPIPGDPVPRLVVRVTVPAGGPGVDPEVLDRLVAFVKPAHLSHQVLLGTGAEISPGG